jgi:D-aminoacyl-tRNA deacylase
MELIVASRKDPAAENIRSQLLELYDFESSNENPELYTHEGVGLISIPGGVTQLTALPVDAEGVIFASRHASRTGRPTLTAHVPGEPSEYKLAIASPPTIKAALRELSEARDGLGLSYDVSLEATHHGPTRLKVPVTFVEIGSTPQQWRDPKAGEAVARAIMTAARKPIEGRPAIGFGGTHYARKHTEVVLRTDVGIGHIFPKYLSLDEKLAREALARTKGGSILFALDWKGLRGKSRERIGVIATRLSVQAVRERDLLAQAKL